MNLLEKQLSTVYFKIYPVPVDHPVACLGQATVRYAYTGSHESSHALNTGLFKIIVGVQLSSGNSATNLGNNRHLTIPFEGGMDSFKRQGACVSGGLKVRICRVCVYRGD